MSEDSPESNSTQIQPELFKSIMTRRSNLVLVASSSETTQIMNSENKQKQLKDQQKKQQRDQQKNMRNQFKNR